MKMLKIPYYVFVAMTMFLESIDDDYNVSQEDVKFFVEVCGEFIQEKSLSIEKRKEYEQMLKDRQK